MGFSNLREILDRIRRANPGLSKSIQESSALTQWDNIVGPAIAKHARPLKIEEGILYVQVDHAAWRSELHHRQSQVLLKLNSNMPKEKWIIQRIEFVDVSKKRTAFQSRYTRSSDAEGSPAKPRFPKVK